MCAPQRGVCRLVRWTAGIGYCLLLIGTVVLSTILISRDSLAAGVLLWGLEICLTMLFPRVERALGIRFRRRRIS